MVKVMECATLVNVKIVCSGNLLISFVYKSWFCVQSGSKFGLK